MEGHAAVHSRSLVQSSKEPRVHDWGRNGSRVKSNPELFSREVKMPTTAPLRWPKYVQVQRQLPCVSVLLYETFKQVIAFPPLTANMKAGFRPFYNINSWIILKGLMRIKPILITKHIKSLSNLASLANMYRCATAYLRCMTQHHVDTWLHQGYTPLFVSAQCLCSEQWNLLVLWHLSSCHTLVWTPALWQS